MLGVSLIELAYPIKLDWVLIFNISINMILNTIMMAIRSSNFNKNVLIFMQYPSFHNWNYKKEANTQQLKYSIRFILSYYYINSNDFVQFKFIKSNKYNL